MNPNTLERLSQMGPVAHLIALLCLFLIVLLRVWRRRREAFLPAVAAGLVGILVGGGALIAGMRILGLKVMSPEDLRRLERRGGGWRQRASLPQPQRNDPMFQKGRIGLVVLMRRVNAVTADDDKFLDDRQAAAIVSLLEMVLPMPSLNDKEAGEMLDDLAGRLETAQRERLAAEAIPKDLGLFGPGGWLANPLQSDVNRMAVMALIERYDRVARTTLTPMMLDF